MKPKSIFDEILEKQNEVERLAMAVDNLAERETSITTQISGMPHSASFENKRQDIMNAKIDAERNLDRAKAELKALREWLLPYLARMEKWQLQKAIDYRYLQGKSISMVMAQLGYGEAQTYRYIREGRVSIEKMIEHDRSQI